MSKREKWDQAGKRKTVTFTDQHGREWTAVKDIFTDTNVGPMTPQGWTPVSYMGRDLVPPDHVLRFDDARPGTFTIDYSRWISDIRAAHTGWVQQAGSYAASMYGDKSMDALENPPPALLNAMGPKPMPVELLEAMQEGNRWILGLAVARPAWADKFFHAEQQMPASGRRYEDAEDELVGAGTRARDDKGRFLSAKEGG